MTTAHSDANIAAIEAAQVAFELAACDQLLQPVVFLKSEFNDIYAAIETAQCARYCIPTPVKHHTVHVTASNTLDRLVLNDENIDWPNDGGIVICVATTTSTYPLPLRGGPVDIANLIQTRINLISVVTRGVYINEIIHVIDSDISEK